MFALTKKIRINSTTLTGECRSRVIFGVFQLEEIFIQKVTLVAFVERCILLINNGLQYVEELDTVHVKR